SGGWAHRRRGPRRVTRSRFDFRSTRAGDLASTRVAHRVADDGSGLVISPESARRDAELLLEAATERGPRLVSDALGDVGVAEGTGPQHAHRELHSPAREIRERRCADERREPRGEG